MIHSDQYFDGYLKAVNDPLLELKETFEKETEFLIDIINRNYHETFLDVGCGTGRTIFSLVERLDQAFFTDIDNNQKMIDYARKYSQKYDKRNEQGNLELCWWINFSISDIRGYLVPALGRFDVVYSGYNLIGSIDIQERNTVIDSKKDLCNSKGQIITTSWKQNDSTTEFLMKYYKQIGFKDVNVKKEESIVDGMTFYRLSIDEMVELYRANSLKKIEVHDLGLWNAVVGRK